MIELPVLACVTLIILRFSEMYAVFIVECRGLRNSHNSLMIVGFNEVEFRMIH